MKTKNMTNNGASNFVPKPKLIIYALHESESIFQDNYIHSTFNNCLGALEPVQNITIWDITGGNSQPAAISCRQETYSRGSLKRGIWARNLQDRHCLVGNNCPHRMMTIMMKATPPKINHGLRQDNRLVFYANLFAGIYHNCLPSLHCWSCNRLARNITSGVHGVIHWNVGKYKLYSTV